MKAHNKALKKKEAKKRKGKTGTSRAEAGTFNDEARAEWLSGFRKRKRERRLRGLAYGALKERRDRLAVRAARREANKERLNALPEVPRLHQEERSNTVQVNTYDDQELMDQWGHQVTVTTTLGLDAFDDDDENDEFLRRKKPDLLHNDSHSIDEEEPHSIDLQQIRAGSLETMCKKLAGKVSCSAKASRRHARARDRKAAAKVGKQLGRPASAGAGAASAPSRDKNRVDPKRANQSSKKKQRR